MYTTPHVKVVQMSMEKQEEREHILWVFNIGKAQQEQGKRGRIKAK
jgi:hypothetical protein